MTAPVIDQDAWLSWCAELVEEYDQQQAAAWCATCGQPLNPPAEATTTPVRLTGAEALAQLAGRELDPWLSVTATTTEETQ